MQLVGRRPSAQVRGFGAFGAFGARRVCDVEYSGVRRAEWQATLRSNRYIVRWAMGMLWQWCGVSQPRNVHALGFLPDGARPRLVLHNGSGTILVPLPLPMPRHPR